MNDAFYKTLVLLAMIGLGLVLKFKFNSKAKLDGIKEIILSVALPSTIFIALMKIDLESSLLLIPVFTIIFNFIVYFLSPWALKVSGISPNSSEGRTLILLMPSLAPGLSCFPFIAEFLGEKSLALAAMGDVGNKFFVLIFLYIIAMNMFLKNTESKETNAKSKIMSLLKSLIQEPINIVLVLAIALLSFGLKFETLPMIVQSVFDKTSAIMTPLILIFVGLAVNLKTANKTTVLSLLLFRAGLSLVLSALVIYLTGISDKMMVLLAVVLPLSSISFWPFAHISLFNAKEEQLEIIKNKQTFNVELAVMVLAMSLPFSSGLILAILSVGDYFVDLTHLLVLGVSLVAVGIVPLAIKRRFSNISKSSVYSIERSE